MTGQLSNQFIKDLIALQTLLELIGQLQERSDK
jgi:hypothetical protein